MNENQRIKTRVIENKQISSTAYLLRIERKGLSFRAGELISLYSQKTNDHRDYTIASGENDDELHILYRMVPNGLLTPEILTWQPQDEIEIVGPYGDFILRDPAANNIFIATGTGIAPCHSFIRSHPKLNLSVFHGVRCAEDLFYLSTLKDYSYFPCVSGEVTENAYHGRVTELVKTQTFPVDADFYLCGANEMIYEVLDLLTELNVNPEHIYREPYYYRLDS